MSNIPVIQIGTGNQVKVIEPILAVTLDPSGNPIAIKATVDGKIIIGIPPVTGPLSYQYTVSNPVDNKLLGEYVIIPSISSGNVGIIFAWDGSGEIIPEWSNVNSYYFADPGDVSDINLTPRIQSIVNVINSNSTAFGCSATFIQGTTTTGSFSITRSSTPFQSAPTASVGSWASLP